MFITQSFSVGARDINSSKELTNTALLSYLEDIACIHSEMAGYGISNIEKIKKTWILLSWKVKLFNRPKYADKLLVKTWSKEKNKFYAYRDFEIYNSKNELIGIATSKWVFIDIEKRKIISLSKEISDAYNTEEKTVFEDKDVEKLKEPKGEYLNKIDYKITKNMIDINKHLHNTYYMDLAKEVLPDEISLSNEANEFEVMYKTEIKLGETVKVMYLKDQNCYYAVIKDQEENKLHAILKLKYFE